MTDKGIRKFILALTTLGVIFAGYLVTPFAFALSENYDGFAWAAVGVLGTFAGFNVWEKRRKQQPGQHVDSPERKM